MKRLILCTLALVLLSAALVAAEEVLPVDPSKYVDAPTFIGNVPDEFIVVLKDNVAIDHGKDARATTALSDFAGFDNLAAQYGVSRLKPQFPGADKKQTANADRLARHYKVRFETGTLEEAMAAYAANPSVDHVEPIGIHALYATPNDTYYDDPPPEFPYDQWHYWDTYGISANTAWDMEPGDQTVIVGDLDIGTKYDHGDLGGSNPPGPNDASTNGNIWVNTNEIPGNSIDDDGNGYVDDIIGWDFVDRTDWYSYNCIDSDCGGADNDPSDGDGHGTHTAGTIAAITNNGYSVAGVAGGFGDGTYAGGGNGVKVVPCRIGYVLDYAQYGAVGVVIMDYVAEAMYYMAELKVDGWNVAAINCSFGTTNSGGLAAACDYLQAQDVMIVVAAGNSSSSSADYLGSRGDCLDVGATDQDGDPASFTNYGSWVDIAAPGVGIMSTITDPSDPTGDYIAPMDGTSMACPHVVGVAALLESYNPSLTAQEKFDIITDPANTTPYNPSRDLGAGIVDVRKCLEAAGGGDLPPVANFSGTPLSGGYPLTVDFTDMSSNTPTTWAWDFGDGTGTSSAQNPSYTYTSAGTYTVSLTATNAYGSDGETKTGYITVTSPPPPTADFSGTPTSGEYPLLVSFTDLSTENPFSWDWDFGDGTGTSTAQNPSYTYTAAGTYTVSLTATNAIGSDTETKTGYITVTEPGVATKAYALSDIPTYGSISGSYANTSASDNSYEVLTEVASTSHPRKTTSQLEHKWDFSVDGGTTVTFYVEAYRPSNSDGDNFVFEYSTDNSTFLPLVTVASSTEQVYSAALPANTSGTVWVRVTDSNRSWGNSSNDALYVDQMYIEYETAAGPPVAAFSGTPTSGGYPLLVNFTDLSTGNPTSWSWNFGDGSGTSTTQNPSYTYTAAGTYTVSLTATNAYGSDAETKTGYITVTAPPPPTANFSGTPTSGDYPLLVSFTDLSSESPTSWNWNFGDGSGTSTAQNPSYTYTAAGTYTVSLTATNAYGSDTETKTDYITVSEPGTATMFVENIVVGRTKSGPNYLGTATVTVYDNNNQGLAGATVYVTATGPTGGTYNGVTGSGGTVSFQTGGMKKPSGEWCFEVTNMTHATNSYDSGSNNVTQACESGWVYGFSSDMARVDNLTPSVYELSQNYPNPFNPTTEITFSLPTAQSVNLTVYNVAGQEVKVIVNRFLEAGTHSFEWDAGSTASGVYLYRLEAGDFTDTRKMILLK